MTRDLTEASLADVLVAMRKFCTARGRRVTLRPTKVIYKRLPDYLRALRRMKKAGYL